MPAYQHCTLALEAVQQYFAHLNPLAQRIACDINDTKSTYGQLWCTLSPNEQNDIINETLIKPEISLRYFDSFSTSTVAEPLVSPSPASMSPTPSSCSTHSGAHILQRQSSVVDSSAVCTSAESLTTAVLKNTPRLLNAVPITMQPLQHLKLKPPTDPPPPPPACPKPRAVESLEWPQSAGNKARSATTKSELKPTRNMHNCYAYDGRNVRTYALQKVALKIIHDDISGTYRDEHSFPFSYRTKSQINLFQQQLWSAYTGGSAQPADGAVCLLNDSNDGSFIVTQLLQPEAAAVRNYRKLQSELKQSLYSQLEKNKYSNMSSYKCLENVVRPVNSAAVNNVAGKLEQKQLINGGTATDLATLTATVIRTSNRNSSANGHSVMLHNTENKTTPNKNRNGGVATSAEFNYAVYTDAYYEHGERSYLMQNCSNSSVLTASSSSATTSDDDERNNYDDDDEKTLCEDVKLLDNDMSLRKGFDFLNNW